MAQKISKQITYWLGVVAVGLVAGLGIQFVQAGWTEPSGAPGTVNIAAPVNVSNITQTKAGVLNVLELGASNVTIAKKANGTGGSLSVEGNVGIGTTSSPSQKLDVAGTVKATGLQITTGAGTGKVLTSDASGTATWQTPAGGGGSCRLCASCGGSWPAYAGSPLSRGDWGWWRTLGSNCSGGWSDHNLPNGGVSLCCSS